MKYIKKSFIILTILLSISLVFTNKVFADESEQITFKYYQKLEEETLVNLNVTNMPSDQTFKKGVTFTNILKPSSNNYTFNYWVYFIEGVEHILKVGDKFYTDTNFYAKWTPTLRGIYYYLDGGVNHKNNPNHFYGYETTTLNDPVKEGYKFLGWYNNPEFNLDPITNLGDGDKSTSLYAKWERIPTIGDLRNYLNLAFKDNVGIDETNQINLIFDSLIETSLITSDLTNTIETLIANITSGSITINSQTFTLLEANVLNIVDEILTGINLQSFLDLGEMISINYQADVIYKGENFLFTSDINLEVNIITEVEVETLEELLFVLARPKVKDIYLVEDITLTSNIEIKHEINLYSLNNILNFNGKDILFSETIDDAFYEIEGIFQNGTITLNNSKGHFDLTGLEGNNVNLIIIASASNTVNIKGFWGSVNINDSTGRSVVEAIINNLIVEGSSKVETSNSTINKLTINDQAIVLIIGEDVSISEIENENNGLYYDKVEKYDVSFVDNGITTIQRVNSGNKVIPTNPTKVGYTFVGWYLNEVLFDFNTLIKTDITLNAVYELSNFNITISGYNNPVTYPNSINLSASNDALVGSASYKWYKDNNLVSESESLVLTEVDDSGTYIVHVTLTDGSYTKTLTKSITVTILPEEVLVTPTGTLSKTYGNSEPSYSYSLAKTITVNGNISRVIGEDAGSYLFSVDNLIPLSNNYKLVINQNVKFIINKADATLTSSFADVRGYKVVEIDYTNNALKTFTSNDLESGLLSVFVGSIDETSKVDFNFSNINLSKGASTFIEQVTITGNNINTIVVNIAFKFKTVIIEGDNTLYTIEDAIAIAKRPARMIVLNHTSFAEQDIAKKIYNETSFIIGGGIYLVLPNGLFDDKGKHESEITSKINNAPKINRNDCLVKLNVPSGITINVNSGARIIVNAIRGTAQTAYQGFVTGSNYSVLNLEANAKVVLKKGTVNSTGGQLLVAGFVTGEGSVEALEFSKIEDVMFVESFRGGTDTYNVFEHAFPFYQFSIANIEVDVKINTGVTYNANVFLYIGGSFIDAKLVIVEPASEKSKALIQMSSGYAMKKYDTTTGETLIELYGVEGSLNETSMKAGGFTISSVGIDMSFNGRWKFEANDNSELTINSYMLLFPGASITVDESSSLIVSDGARLTVFNPYEFIEDDKIFNKYPNPGVLNYLRTEISYTYNAYTSAALNINGSLIVNAGAEIAGIINEGPNAYIFIDDDAITEYTIKYVLGSSYAYVLERVVKLWTDEDYYISVTANPVIGFKPKEGEEEVPFNSTIKAYIMDKDRNLVSGTASYEVEIYTILRGDKDKIIGSMPTGQIVETGTFDFINGFGTFNFTTDVYNGYGITITYQGVSAKQMLYVGEASSPFLYAEGENGKLYFEHEPFGYSMIKAIENTTYGTLRLIKDQNGVYYIQIIEEGNSTTALNNVELYAIDYEANQGVIDAMFDIYGNPHTLKELISPKEFIDNLGNDLLDNVLIKDDKYATINDNQNLFSYYEALFNKPLNANYAKLVITARGSAGGVEFVGPFLQNINYQQNLWWLDEALGHESVKETIKNVFDIFEMLVQVYDGTNWVTKASIQPKTYFDEDLLVYLDLSDINTSDLKVRLLFPTMMNYKINSIYVDYSDDVNMIVNKLDLVSAILNNQLDILDLVNEIDNNYVYLNFKDSARLGFMSTPLKEGYERFIGVSATGYIYTSGTIIEHELRKEVENKTFEEIVEIITNSNDLELTNYLESVSELYYLLLQLGNLEYEEIVYILVNMMKV